MEIEQTPEEILLEQVLRGFAEKAELPAAILLSSKPHHELFDLVNKAWGGRHGRDGRRKHLSDEDVAAEISKRIGRYFSRNQYQSMFGRRGRTLGLIEFYRQKVPRDVARGFLETAFAFWTVSSPEKTGVPLRYNPPIDFDATIANACEAIYTFQARNEEARAQDRKKDITDLLRALLQSGQKPISLEDIEFILEMERGRSPVVLKLLLTHRRETERSE